MKKTPLYNRRPSYGYVDMWLTIGKHNGCYNRRDLDNVHILKVSECILDIYLFSLSVVTMKLYLKETRSYVGMLMLAVLIDSTLRT